MKKNYFFTLTLLISAIGIAQVNYSGNGNTGFGGPIGNSSLAVSDDGTTITFTITKGTSGDFNDNLIIYLDTGAAGRNVINTDVNDNNDPLRTAISNGDSNGFDSVVTFPAGFEAFYTIGISSDFVGLFSIPSTGTIGDNGLTFEDTLIAFPAFDPTDSTITFSIDWADLGLANTDSFDFIGLYSSGTAFTSNEGYGDGLPGGSTNLGGDDATFTSFLTYANTLSTPTLNTQEFNVTIVNKNLSIKGLNDNANVSVYDMLGKLVFNRENEMITNNTAFDLSAQRKGIYIVRVQSNNILKTKKVVLN